MKKKVIALLMTVFMMLTMAGCTAQGTSLLGELKQMSAWENQECTGTFNFEFAMGEGEDAQKVALTADCSSYMNAKTLQGEFVLTLKQAQYNGMTLDFTQGVYKLSPITMYMDGMKFYVSTTPIKEVAKLLGEDVSTVEALSADYVGLDMTEEVKAAGFDVTKVDDFYAKAFKIYEDSKVELQVAQNGREYTIELNANEMVDKYIALCKELLNNPMITASYKKLGLTDEEIMQALSEAPAMLDTMAEQIKPYIQGSNAKVTYAFTDNTCKETAELNGVFTLGEEKGTLTVKADSDSKKVAAKTITIPTNAKVYTMAEIEKLAVEPAVEESTTTVAE